MIKALKIKLQSFKINVVFETLFYYIKRLYKKFERDHIWVLSSGIAFNIVLCIIPFNLILFSVLGLYLESSDTLDKFREYLNNVLPVLETQKEKFINYIMERVSEITSYTFLTGVIGIGGLIWLMSGLFSSMRDVLNKIYNVEDNINFLIGKLRDFALIIVTVVLFLSTLILTSGFQIINDYSQGIFFKLFATNIFEKLIPFVVPLVVTYILFYILYAHVTNIKFPKKVVAFSAIIAAVLFEILKYLFTMYVLKFSTLGEVYGAYAAFVIVLFWIYYISVVFVVGAALGQIYLERNKIDFPHEKKYKSKFYGTAKVIQNN
jgi:membrane protein